MGLFCAIKLLMARYRALFPTQSSFDALFDNGFSGALNRHTTDMQSLWHLLIGPSRALWALIGLQKNAGSRQFVRGGFPFGNHSEEIVSFFIDSGHFVAFGRHEPFLSRRAHPVSDVWRQDNAASYMHQIKSDSALVCIPVPPAGCLAQYTVLRALPVTDTLLIQITKTEQPDNIIRLLPLVKFTTL